MSFQPELCAGDDGADDAKEDEGEDEGSGDALPSSTVSDWVRRFFRGGPRLGSKLQLHIY